MSDGLWLRNYPWHDVLPRHSEPAEPPDAAEETSSLISGWLDETN